MNRILALLTITVFLGMSFAPMAHSMVNEGPVHSCKQSDGPCKHGAACPVKHRSHKKGPDRDSGHGKGGNCFIECSHSGNTSKLFTALEMPFIITAVSFYTPITFEKFFVNGQAFYKDTFPDPFDRPPAVF
jgi:hypothetical protein